MNKRRTIYLRKKAESIYGRGLTSGEFRRIKKDYNEKGIEVLEQLKIKLKKRSF